MHLPTNLSVYLLIHLPLYNLLSVYLLIYQYVSSSRINLPTYQSIYLFTCVPAYISTSLHLYPPVNSGIYPRLFFLFPISPVSQHASTHTLGSLRHCMHTKNNRYLCQHEDTGEGNREWPVIPVTDACSIRPSLNPTDATPRENQGPYSYIYWNT